MTNYQRDQLLQLKPWSDDFKSKKAYIKGYLDASNPATYYKDGRVQCGERKNRSYIDLYYLTKAKFKSTTKNEVIRILYELCSEERNFYRTLVCTGVKEVVFFTEAMWSWYPNQLHKRNLNGYMEYWNMKNNNGVTLTKFVEIAKKSKVK